MPTYNRDEMQLAFEHYQHTINDCGRLGDWNPYVELFTDDAAYVDHVLGTQQGRESIRTHILATMASFPAKLMTRFSVGWHTIDPDNARIVCELHNVLTDPGDGTIFNATNWTLLHYAGNNQWSREEDNYNPFTIAQTITDWAHHTQRLGTTLPDDITAGVALLTGSKITEAIDNATSGAPST